MKLGEWIEQTHGTGAEMRLSDGKLVLSVWYGYGMQPKGSDKPTAPYEGKVVLTTTIKPQADYPAAKAAAIKAARSRLRAALAELDALAGDL